MMWVGRSGRAELEGEVIGGGPADHELSEMDSSVVQIADG